MKKLFVFCLSLLIFSTVCAPAAMAARKVLSVPGYQQEKSHWCWAASDKSIIQYCKGSSPTQSQIVTFVFGSPVDQGATTDQARSALTHWNVVSSRWYDPLSYSAVQSQINNNHPIFATLQIGATTPYGHANVIRGYDTSYTAVLFIDPKDGNYHAQNYYDYKNGYHWDGVCYNWIHSIFDCR